MSGDAKLQSAIRLLGDQIEQLRALRNANVRDSEFKQWRQNALTAVQRLWPGDAKRSGRFRKIPFSPPSAQASIKDQREQYERGCAEALQFLEQMLLDLKKHGLPAGNGTSKPPSLHVELASEVPTIELPPDGKLGRTSQQNEDAPRARGRKGATKKRLKDMLGFDEADGVDEAVAASGDASPSAKAPANEGIEASAPAGGSAAEMPEEARPVAEDATEDQDMAEIAEDRDALLSDGDAAEGDAPAHKQADPVEATADDREDETAEDGDDDGDDLEAQDFLLASPVFTASGKPIRRVQSNANPPRQTSRDESARVQESPMEEIEADAADRTPAPASPPARALRMPAAIAVAILAAEVDRLGVPVERRASTRAALTDLADLLEAGDMGWEELRGAVGFAMDTPAIGRRLLPLLIPFLDRAA